MPTPSLRCAAASPSEGAGAHRSTEHCLTPRERRIAHLDMDAFYASVELLRRPELRGLPVAIGGRGEPNSRGVVTTATYAARAFGIRSGMALRKALDLCPACVFLPVDFDEYRRYSRLFKAALASQVDTIEDRGIDEVYIDLTDVDGDSRTVAQSLKQAVASATGLTCSIAVAPNKLLAKIGSDLDKPDGLTVLELDDLAIRIWPLPARRINGVGPRAQERLSALGIETIGNVAATSCDLLVQTFGTSYGNWLHQAAHGVDERPVVTHREPQSRSRETTFDRDLHARTDRAELSRILEMLAKQVSADLATRGYVGRTIGIKIRFDDFSIVTRDCTVRTATNDAPAILAAARECLRRVGFQRRLRLLGVRVGHLSRVGELAANDGETLPLF